MRDWIDFYDSEHSIYVSGRHREVHFSVIADHIAAYIPSPDAVVVDYSCGEALSASRVADACGRLVLAEPAPNLRARLAERHKSHPKIEVCSLDELARLPAHSTDLVVMNSVTQYVAPDELRAALSQIRTLLKNSGRLVVGDVVKPDTGALTDAAQLLRFAGRHGFFKDAVTGLVRTALSDYRRLRARIGLNRYGEDDMLARLRAAGFQARRAPDNLGHNTRRMTFVATAM